MKFWQLATLSAAALAFMSCSGSSSTSGDSLGACESPALTKACLEGTWEMHSKYLAQYQSVKNADASLAQACLPLFVTSGADQYYKLEFTAKKRTPTDPENLTTTIKEPDYSALVNKNDTYAISEDGSALVIKANGDEANFYGGNIAMKMVAVPTGGYALQLTREEPLFASKIPGCKVVEFFYKAP